MAIERDKNDPKASWNKPRAGHKKKNTKRWCKGIVGREHVLEVSIPHNAIWFPRENGVCHEWKLNNKTVWWCSHYEMCTACNKQVRRAKVCPDNVDNVPHW